MSDRSDAERWEADAIEKLNDYKCAMIDLNLAKRRIVELETALAKLCDAHESILTTLGPSRSAWARHICRNAGGFYYETLRPRDTLANRD
jgi:uncharacterized protein YPO0396